MNQKQSLEVMFISGPLDGHVRPVYFSESRSGESQLDELVAIPIQDKFVTQIAEGAHFTGDSLNGSTRESESAISSVAVYVREDCEGEARYQYLGLALPSQFPRGDCRK